jgi:hypothetical protein
MNILTPCKMVPPRRFERLTYGLGIRCSILLSYGGIFFSMTYKNPSSKKAWPKCDF